MNDRIEQLKGEAVGFYMKYPWSTLDQQDLAIFSKKFAELIVRECADLFEVEWGSSMLQGTNAAHYLKQHFGVE